MARAQDDIGRLGVHLGAAGSSSRTCASTGMTPDEPPWLVAKRIDVSLTWGALLHREVLLDIDRDDRLADGRRVVSRTAANLSAADRAAAAAAHRPAGSSSRRCSTCAPTAASSCSTITDRTGARSRRNLDVTVAKAAEYRGQARFTDGTIIDPEVRADDGRHDGRLQGRTTARSCSIASTW